MQPASVRVPRFIGVFVAAAALAGSAAAAPAATPKAGEALRPIAGGAGAAPAPPDTSPGIPVGCVDAATGTPFTYRALRLSASGTVDGAWAPDSATLCLGSAEGLRRHLVRRPAGGGYAAWEDARRIEPDVWVQRFTGAGEVATGWPLDGLPVCVAARSQHGLSVAPDGAGGVLLAWQDHRDAQPRVWAMRLAESGSAADGWPVGGRAVSTGGAHHVAPSIAPDGSGGAWLVWEARAAGAAEVFIQRLAADGAAAAGWPEGGARWVAAGHAPIGPRVVTDSGGAGLIAWRETGAGGLVTLVAAPIPQGPPGLERPAGAILLSSGEASADAPSFVDLAPGVLLAAWAESGAADGTVRVQRLVVGGALRAGWTPGGIVVGTGALARGTPVLVSDGAGGAYLAWEVFGASADLDIAAQRVSGAGSVAEGWPAAGRIVVGGRGGQWSPRLGGADTSGVLVTWMDEASGSAGGYLSAHAHGRLPHVELVAATALPNRAELEWRALEPARRPFTVHRRLGEAAWEAVVSLAPSDSGALRFVDRGLPGGVMASYRLSAVREAVEVFYDAVGLAIPEPPRVLTLHWARPEPGAGIIALALALPPGEPPAVELYDVAGRRAARRVFEGLDPGEHRLRFEIGRRIPPGVYFLRLRQGRESRSAKLVYLR